MSNPILYRESLPLFDQIKAAHITPAIEGILKDANALIKSLKDKNAPITVQMIDHVLDEFFKHGKMIEFRVKDIVAIKSTYATDVIEFKINLPAPAALLLSKKQNRSVVKDLYESAILYVEKTWTDDVIKFALNGQIDKVTILSDGVGEQKETKADIKVTINGQKYERQISLKVAGGEQFAQVSGDEFEKQQKVWEEILKLNISELKEAYLAEVRNYDKKEVFSSRENARLTEFKDMIKSAAAVVYKEAAKQMQAKINTNDNAFLSNITKLVFMGATKGDASIELVKLEGGKFKQLQFNKDFMKVYTEQLKKSNLKAKFRETGDPLVQIYAGSETKSNLLLQIRAKVEARSLKRPGGKVYGPYMRNLVEAGPLMFALLK